MVRSLLKLKNRIQSKNIVLIQTLAGTQVQIAEHPNLYFSKANIRDGERFFNYEYDIFKHELAQYGVVDLSKIKKKIEGSLKDTSTIILTLEGCDLPDSIKISWNRFDSSSTTMLQMPKV